MSSDTQAAREDTTLANAAVALSIAGLVVPLCIVGSIGGLICGYRARHNTGAVTRSRATIGIVLGWLGVAAPVVLLFVYCVVLGHPFPIARYHGD